MLGWLAKDKTRKNDTVAFCNVTDGLHRLYKEKLLPLEQDHDFHSFHSGELTEADFMYRPMVLLLGQYSTGKTTFIRHLLSREYPGLRVGPEPTTDKFTAVIHGAVDQVISGHAAIVDNSLPFKHLGTFGNSFLSRFECARTTCPVLEGISLIDTPGVLAGEKQRLKRGYEFEAVVKWFADRVDMILILFDVSKMDISDEFRRVIEGLQGNDSKIHIMLNKADVVTTSELMRVYGALMWSLGKVIDTAEVARVYIGSFWDEPLSNDEQRKLFESEENDLFTHLACLPRSAAVRKLNDLIKRARLAKVHACLLDHLKKKLPSMWGKDSQSKKLISNLTSVYQAIAKEHKLSLGDFPDPQLMKEKLADLDFARFAKIDKKKMERLEWMLSVDFPRLLQMLPAETSQVADSESIVGGVSASPFAVLKVNGMNEISVYQSQWLVAPSPEDYRSEFIAFGPNAVGKITGQQAKTKMVQSKLPSNALHKIWSLADVDRDGALTLYEFSLAMHFIKMKLNGQDLPASLPPQMLPTSEN